MKRRTGILCLVIISLFTLATGIVYARDTLQGETCVVEEDETIQGTLFTFCQVLTVRGRVEGNIVGIALRAFISGEVTESAYIAGTQMTLTGIVRRDLHYAGISLNISSPDAEFHTPVRGQLFLAALSTRISRNARINGAITGAGYQLLVDGAVGGEVNFWGSALYIDNAISGDVYATVGNPESDGSDIEPLLIPLNINTEFVDPGMLVGVSGTINGRLSYLGPVEGIISGTVRGSITYTSSTPVIPLIAQEEGSLSIFFNSFTREIAVLLTTGLTGLLFAPNLLGAPISNLRWRPVPSFVIGMLMFIVSFPIALILLLLTAIIILVLALLQLDGILLVVASFLALLDGTIIGVFYFVAIFVARAVFCLALGRLLVHITIGYTDSNRMNILSLVAGVIIFAFFAALPGVGFVFNAAALFMGLGSILNVLLEWLQSLRDNSYANTWSPTPSSVDMPPRLMPSQQPPLPSPTIRIPPKSPENIGMQDLPEGFDADFFFHDD